MNRRHRKRPLLEQLEPKQLLTGDVLPLPVADINSMNSGSDPAEFTQVGDRVFFSARVGDSGRELWMSDGTFLGTRLVKDIRRGRDDSNPRELTAVGNLLYFVAQSDNDFGPELWRTDGTDAGTVLVLDASTSVSFTELSELTAFGGSLFFSMWDAAHGFELWRSEGTAQTTRRITDIVPGVEDSNPRPV